MSGKSIVKAVLYSTATFSLLSVLAGCGLFHHNIT